MRRAVLAAFVAVSIRLAPAAAQDAAALAQQRYVRGVQLFNTQHHAEALAEFRAALALYDSPNPRLYVARSLLALGDVAEAALEFEHTANQARDRARLDPRYMPTAQAAEQERREIEPRLGYVIVSVAPATTDLSMRIGNHALPAAALGMPVPVVPGDVAISTHADGFLDASQHVQVQAGARIPVTLTLQPAPRPPARGERPYVDPRPRVFAARVAAGVSAGIGVVGFVSFAVFYALASERFTQLEMMCGTTECTMPAQYELLSSGRTFQTATNVGLVTGIAGISLGVLAFAIFGRMPATNGVRATISPEGVALFGRF